MGSWRYLPINDPLTAGGYHAPEIALLPGPPGATPAIVAPHLEDGASRIANASPEDGAWNPLPTFADNTHGDVPL